MHGLPASPPSIHHTLTHTHTHSHTHTHIPIALSIAAYVLICGYFTALDLCKCKDTKIQRDYWPSARDIWTAAAPQLAAYTVLLSASWIAWSLCPAWMSVHLPKAAPSMVEFAAHLSFCFVVGDFLIYWEHRIMHTVPYLRRNIHSVHHEYTAVFSWAGGWVHPVEDAVVVICQAIPVLMLGCHPITYWAFAVLWVVCLIDEHSGHDVWWSPYQLLPFTGSPMGGGENYTM